jgi:hypothetical protein
MMGGDPSKKLNYIFNLMSTETETKASDVSRSIDDVVRRGTPDHEYPHIYNLSPKGEREVLQCSCGEAYSFGAGWIEWLKKHGSDDYDFPWE